MPLRPRSHVLEDESVRAFEGKLPSKWIFRREAKDYGIDGSVEIVDEQGTVSGQRFYVQLKATDQSRIADAYRIRLTRAAVDYYGVVDLPTLLIRYHAPSRTLLFRWFHDVDPYYAKVGEKTISFRFNEADKWTPQTPNQLLADLENCRWIHYPRLVGPLILSLEIDRSSISPERANELAGAIEAEAVHLGIDIREIAPTARGKVFVRGREIAVHLPAGKRATLHHQVGLVECLPVESLVADTFVALGLALGQANHIAYAKSILQSSVLRSTCIAHPKILEAIAAVLAADQTVADLICLANDLEDRGHDPHVCDEFRAQAMLLSPRRFTNEEWIEISTEFDRWLELAEKVGDQKRLARANYNCGRFYGVHAGPKATPIDYYRKALRCDPTYRNRYYFWSEIGGTLFDQGRFTWAAKAYKQSHTLGAPVEVVARYADALLHAGDYRASESVFAEYLKTDNPEAHWILSARAPNLIEKYVGVEFQGRAPDKAAEILAIAAPPKDSGSENRMIAVEALKQDALHPEGWYLLGWVAQAAKDWDQAAWCFTLAALFERTNVHFWTSALLMCLNAKPAEALFPFLLVAGYRVHHGNLYRTLANELRRSLPENIAEDGIRILRESLESLPPAVVPREIRVLKDDGSFEVVDLEHALER
jgi:tetratricopeptide (TPR) repeat protein